MKKVNLCKGLKEVTGFPSDNKIKATWKKPLPELFKGKSIIRYVPNEYGSDFKVLYNKRRATNLTYPKNKCPFSIFVKSKYYTLGNYILTPNIYPFSKHHRLLITKKHYSKPKLKDLKFIHKFCELVNTTAILSIKGSGAGIPGHVHFQVFDEKLPVMDAKTSFLFSNGEVAIYKLIFPSYGIKLIGKNIPKWLFKILNNIPYPYNLAMENNQVIIYPRTTVRPTKSPKWRFGATELSGFVITRDKEIFDSITSEEINKYLKKATISKQKDKLKFEETIRKIILK
jgi:hypothetical protein